MKKTKKASKTVEKSKTTTENSKKTKVSVKKVTCKVAKKATKTKPGPKSKTKKAPTKKATKRSETSLSEKAYKNFRKQAASQENVPEKEIVTLERRKIISAKITGPQKNLIKREKTVRRRQIDPTTCERDYTSEEIAFMGALDEYKRQSGRMFPTCSEILEVFRNLGYVKQTIHSEPELNEIEDVAVVNNLEDSTALEPFIIEKKAEISSTTMHAITLAGDEQFGKMSDSGQVPSHFNINHLDDE